MRDVLRDDSEITSSFNRAGVAPRVGKNLPRPAGHAVKQDDQDAELNDRITRRRMLQMGSAATLPLLTATSASAQNGARDRANLVIGISTLGFAEYTNHALAEELAAAGFGVIQLFLSQTDSRYWQYNGRADVSDLKAQRCEEIAETYRSQGLSIHSIGVYTNLIEPEKENLEANLAYFDAMMRIGGDMGVRTFITEAGHHHPDKPPSGAAYHFQEEVWNRMVATGRP